MTKSSFRILLSLQSACLSLLFICSPSAAQQEETSPDEPLRLEATIRGDKEQPRVISIVPWQLPIHREIEGTLSWEPSNKELEPLNRKQFLRKVALSKQFSATGPFANPPVSEDNH
ncbi:hypothetical protein Q4561_00725 [Alteromonas sp. 1_MG-2023]|uniref:hypothetical protein n=1 Tax=Alteromonas sp. 1_MG-2023 TaxID=3062669 RepID=UPI0026E117F6|nr:hypothetical protein [Alteromonas sp. 1_MG-2023]MDO6565569.1 hypothetical protein [Alteromonas sp. 1_MG-2023]